MPARPSLAVLMDPLDTIKPAKDSTIAMLKAAAGRGLETLVFGLGDLSVRDGRAHARLAPIEVMRDGKAWYRTARTRPSTCSTSIARTCSSAPSRTACWSSTAHRG